MEGNKHAVVFSIIIVLLLILAIVVGVFIYLQQQSINKISGQIGNLDDRLTAEDADEVMDTAEAIDEEVVEMAEANTYLYDDVGFDLPDGYFLNNVDGQTAQIVPVQKGDGDTPLPVATIHSIHKGGEFTLGSGQTPLESSDITINDLTARKLILNIPAYAEESRCPVYHIDGNYYKYSVSLYECMEWGQFEDMVMTFRLK